MNRSSRSKPANSNFTAIGIVLCRNRRSEQGQAIVEFAMVMPILVILLMAVVFFAMGFNLQMVLNAAAREGAKAWASNRAGTSPCLPSDITLVDPYNCDPTHPATDFNKTVVPLVRTYMKDNGYDGVNVVFEKVRVTKKDLSAQDWNQIIDSAEDATKVKLIIYYPYRIPTASLDFTLITLKAEYTFKRGS